MDHRPHIVIVGGSPSRATLVRAVIGAETVVVAVDAGLDHAFAAAWAVDLAIGDFDSVSPATLDLAVDAGIEIIRHPADKDETDLELALDAVAARWPDAEVDIVAIDGGRPDHLLANYFLCADDAYLGLGLTLHLDHGTAWVCHGTRTLPVEAGATVSVLPIAGDAAVSSTGLQWPLDRSTLRSGRTRGVSNVASISHPTVTVHSGTVIAMSPHPDFPEVPR